MTDQPDETHGHLASEDSDLTFIDGVLVGLLLALAILLLIGMLVEPAAPNGAVPI